MPSVLGSPCDPPYECCAVQHMQSHLASAHAVTRGELHWPHTCRMHDTGDAVDVAGGAESVLYARISTTEQDVPSDMMDWWQEPASYFLIKGEYFTPLVLVGPTQSFVGAKCH